MLSSRVLRITPSVVFFAIASIELALLAVSIRTGLVSLALPADKLQAGEMIAALTILPVFAALGLGTSPQTARYAILFCTGLALAGLDLTLLVSIRPNYF
jgi:hypothetical protein